MSASAARTALEANLEELLSRYSPALYRTALRLLGNPQDAEDAVQDALLSAFVHLDQFQGRSHISTWLHRIVMNAAKMQLRRRVGRTFLSLDDVDEDGQSFVERQLLERRPNPEQACAASERSRKIEDSLKHISPKLRNVVQLHHMGDFSTRESAQILGITPDAVKSQARRARAKLSMLLAEVA